MNNNVFCMKPFTIPLAQMHVDEDTSELKSCKLYRRSNLQVETENIKVDEDISYYRVLEEFPTIKNILNQYVNKVLGETIGYDANFAITTSWMTLTTKNSKSQKHVHKNSFWSAVYYFDDDYGKKAGRIGFQNPIPQLSSFLPEIKEDEINSITANEIYLKPRSKMLILFPSYVYHEIAIHREDNDRRSLAFNIVPTGLYGTGDSRYDTGWFN
mgnify:CR=1 FL=1